MRRQQTEQCAAWRCRREQYLRESGRHVDLIREGYASADDTTNWTVVVGGRALGALKRVPGTRLFLVKPSPIFVPVAKKPVHGQRATSVPGGRR
jgi:hypothetical protein